jgi:hypothetical protein
LTSDLPIIHTETHAHTQKDAIAQGESRDGQASLQLQGASEASGGWSQAPFPPTTLVVALFGLRAYQVSTVNSL